MHEYGGASWTAVPAAAAGQAELFRAAAARKGIRHAYPPSRARAGFRRAETVVTCLEAELSCHGQVLGSTRPGSPG